NITDLKLIVPAKHILGNKKEPAQFPQIKEWLLQATKEASYLIISIDMLVYGGIVPSRLHTLSHRACHERLNVLEEIKQNNPAIRIYAFNLVMRTPSKNNSDEEPEYYADYGSDIYSYGYIQDKSSHQTITEEEQDLLDAIKKKIPNDVLQDYLTRRETNARINEATIELVATDTI